MLAVAILVVAACSTGPSRSPDDSSLQVVATTTVFADIVANVGGDRVAVRSIIPAGVGPEDYEPKPDDARALDGADLIVSNGVGLDDFLDGLVEANGNDAPRLILGEEIPTPSSWTASRTRTSGSIRAWSSPATCRPSKPRSRRSIRPGAATYRDNAAAYASRDRGDGRAKRWPQVDTIPPPSRKLVTFHDAFPYFARHYGFELVGVILANPGQEPSAHELAALIDAVKAAGVKAVFSEAQFSPALAETLAREAGIATVVTTLYNDALGPAPADTYLGMMRWNVTSIVEALR